MTEFPVLLPVIPISESSLSGKDFICWINLYCSKSTLSVVQAGSIIIYISVQLAETWGLSHLKGKKYNNFFLTNQLVCWTMKEHHNVSLDFTIYLCTYTCSLQENNDVSDRDKSNFKITYCILKVYWKEFARFQSQGFKSEVKKLPLQLSFSYLFLYISL